MSNIKGNRVITPDGGGEVVEAIGDKVEVKLDNGKVQSYPANDVTDDSSAG